LQEETSINNKQVLGRPKKEMAQALSSIVLIEPRLATSLELPVKALHGPLLGSTGSKKKLRVVAELEDEAFQPPHITITHS
jgi:hypothetical protein